MNGGFAINQDDWAPHEPPIFNGNLERDEEDNMRSQSGTLAKIVFSSGCAAHEWLASLHPFINKDEGMLSSDCGGEHARHSLRSEQRVIRGARGRACPARLIVLYASHESHDNKCI